MQNVGTAPNKVQNINNIDNNIQNNDLGSTQMSMQNNPNQTIEYQMQNDQKQMQNIKKVIKSIQDRMQMNQNKVQNIQNQMQNDQNKMLFIQSKMQSDQNEINTIKNEVQSKQNQMQSDQNQINTIQNKMQNDQKQMQTIQSQIQNDQNKIQDIQNEMFTIQNRIQINQKIMQDNKKKLQKQNQIQMENNKNTLKQNTIENKIKNNEKISQNSQTQTGNDNKLAQEINNSAIIMQERKNNNLDLSQEQESNFAKMPVVDICNSIILTAVESGASDIHMDPTEEGITVRIRIDGLLRDYLKLPKEIKQNVTTRIKIMAGMNITETRLPQDGAIKDRLKGKDLDLRVSSLPTKRGEKIVIRIMDYSMSLKGIEYLYFSETNYKKVLKMLSTPNGIILVTGATGTGKSTTLYSFLQKLNVEGSNLITVEDPVEMDIAGVNQVQVNSDIGLDFAAVLRSILRQDPNVIMIGEIRDSETAQIAVRASITGHLVLSTIHTNNSLNTIERLLDMDVERYLLASALEGIVSQKLARMLCNKCKIKRPATASEKNLFKSILGQEIKEIYDANPSGCPYCTHGYKGRIAVQEVLLINQDIRDAISAGMRKEELRKLVYNKDVITMLQDGLFKVIAGFTTTDEILKLIEVDDTKTKL